MYGRERRRDGVGEAERTRLRAGLNPAQLGTIATMEQLGWRLRFVRRPMFMEPVPVMFDRDGTRSAVIEADGHANGDHGLRLRD